MLLSLDSNFYTNNGLLSLLTDMLTYTHEVKIYQGDHYLYWIDLHLTVDISIKTPWTTHRIINKLKIVCFRQDTHMLTLHVLF